MNSEQVTINKIDLQVLIVYAQRYTIGRMTYAPSEFKEIILKHLDDLTDGAISVVIRDIELEMERDALGWECDKKLWLDLLERLKSEMKKREKK